MNGSATFFDEMHEPGGAVREGYRDYEGWLSEQDSAFLKRKNRDAETLFLALSDAWMYNVRLWNEGRGLDAIRGRWLERAAGLGSEVAVKVDGRVVRGIFETIDEDCRFVIRAEDGERVTIAAGDVHFGAVASAGSA